MAQAAKARVFMNGRSQHVTIPAEYRFATNEVYIQRDAQTGVISLSEKPLRSSMADIFTKFDEAGAAEFVLERDGSLPDERDLF
jgi:antitoxin VapB